MKNKIIVIVAFLATTLFISSCLKDKVAIDWYGVSGKMYATFTQSGQVWSHTIVSSPTPQTYNIQITIASDAVLSKDYSVNLAVDTAALAAYNLASGKNYKEFPAPSIPSSVTVAAGGRTAWFTITLNNADTLDLNTNWMICLSIVSTSSSDVMVTANKSTFFLATPIANQYEGLYHSVGFRHHPSAGDIPVDKDKYLSTIDKYTVETYPADYTPYRMDIMVNPDNTTTVTSPDASFFDYTATTVDPAGRGIVGGPNLYLPATKQFQVWTYYNAGAPRIIQEMYTKK